LQAHVPNVQADFKGTFSEVPFFSMAVALH
jgi:hypothetical protein